MKTKSRALICAIAVATPVFAGGAPDVKSPFYLALTSMSQTDAAYLFLLDQYLEAKCGREQSIDHLKAINAKGGSSLFVMQALKDGDTAKARNLIKNLPCEGD